MDRLDDAELDRQAAVVLIPDENLYRLPAAVQLSSTAHV